jgi:hypothetical protein
MYRWSYSEEPTDRHAEPATDLPVEETRFPILIHILIHAGPGRSSSAVLEDSNGGFTTRTEKVQTLCQYQSQFRQLAILRAQTE